MPIIVLYAIYAIVISILSIVLVNKKHPISKHNVRKNKERFTPFEFRPMKDLSLEEYIALRPKGYGNTAQSQAILMELNRQGKIHITAIDKHNLLITVKKPEELSDAECNLLAAIKAFQPKSRTSEVIKYSLNIIISLLVSVIFDTGVDILAAANEHREVPEEKVKAVRDPNNPWSTYLRTNAIFEANPMYCYSISANNLNESLYKKGFTTKPEERDNKSKPEWIVLLPLLLMSIPVILYPILKPLFTALNFDAKIRSVEFDAIFGAILIFIPLITIIILKCRLEAIRKYDEYTQKGIDAIHYYEGLKTYLKHVEAKFLNEYQANNKTEFLEITPYAILFGLEKKWSKKLRFNIYS